MRLQLCGGRWGTLSLPFTYGQLVTSGGKERKDTVVIDVENEIWVALSFLNEIVAVVQCRMSDYGNLYS